MPNASPASKKGNKKVKASRKKVEVAEKKAKPTQGKEKAKEVPVVQVEEESDEESDDDDSGVDEEGMTKLMKALGRDGLDDFERAQLRALSGEVDEDEDDEDEDEDGGEDSGEEESVESSDVDEAKAGGKGGEDENEEEDAEDEEDEDGEEEDIPLDDDGILSVDEDAVPRQKIEVNNKIALERIRDTIKLDESLSWTETLVLSYPETIDVDVNDDLNRELAFYKQALHGANAARTLAAQHNFPFTRPTDYFAEMVKTDAHMERIRQRLLDESAGIKKSEDRRREREGKKFGKQVQIEKLKERERGKKEMEERLKGLKRKRKGALDNAQADDGDAFDIAVEDAISDRPAKRSRDAPGGKKQLPRHARDQKFGFGGRGGRHGKQNTRDSTDDFGGGGGRGGSTGGRGRGRGGGRGGAGRGGGGRGGSSRGRSQRPGKDRRVAAKSRS